MAVETFRLEFDILWKDIIELFIEEFIEFFMPDLYPKINFKQAPIFKDKELDKIFGDGKPKDVRRCDKLVQLHLKDGKKCWILVHVEVQKELGNTLPKRMFKYFYRIFDRYEEKSEGIEAITILLSMVSKKNRYNKYTYEYGNTSITYNYRTYELFETSEEELIKNINPFSIVILASRYAVKYKNNEQIKSSFKFKLARLAFERAYDKKRIVQLLTFIYYVITLTDEEAEIEFEKEIKLKLDIMETRTLTFQEGQHIFLSKVFGYDFDINSYISKDLYNNAIKEKEKERKEKEKERKEKEQARKKAEQERKEKEQARKKAEQERKEKDELLKNAIIAFNKNNYTPELIAETLKINILKVIDVLKQRNNANE
jgi:hypothetical protein